MANSLAHTKWMCKYQIVFTPKYRRKIIYNKYKESVVQILKDLCKRKGVEIIEGKAMVDHIHLLVSIPPKYSVSSFMGYLKGKSALMIFDRHANLKYKYGKCALLGARLLCEHSGVERSDDSEIRARAGEGRSDDGSYQYEGSRRPL